MRYCPACKRMVRPIKRFSWVAFIIFLGFLYLPYYLFFKRKECPICWGKHFLRRPPDTAMQ